MFEAAVRSAPSGEQHHLVWQSQKATVVEVGGGLREYRLAGRPVIDGFGEDEMCPGAAGTVLAPWPNRIRSGRYTFGGRTHQLPLTEPEHGNAIHGLVRWQSWQVRSRSADAVELHTWIHPQPGFPFSLSLAVRWSLGREGLRAEHTVLNTGSEPCPFGLGVHPYLCVPGQPVDALELRVPATHVLQADEAGIPTATVPVSESAEDFRIRRRIRSARLDNAFFGLERANDGRAHIEIVGPDGTGAVLWMDESFGYVQVFSGDTLEPPRRRRALAVEPMTCPADAFHSGKGLVILAPGEGWRGTWGVTPV